MTPGIVDDLKSDVDSILGIRDDVGAVLQTTYIVTRTWSGDEPDDGTKTDVATQILPSPRIKQYLDDYRIKEGGAVKQGDIKLTGISKESYPNRSDIDCTVGSGNVEKYYRVGGILYQVIAVEERYLTWEVLLRRTSKQ